MDNFMVGENNKDAFGHGLAFDAPQYEYIPPYTQSALLGWVERGQHGGHFLNAVLTNDLKGVFANADDDNAEQIKNIVMWLHNRAPMICWGDPERVKVWAKHRGLKGLNDKILDANP